MELGNVFCVIACLYAEVSRLGEVVDRLAQQKTAERNREW